MNIFIFHRDLRINDNTTLIKQLKAVRDVVPIFIFTPEQIEPKKNDYYSSNSVQFMIESLHELNNSIQEHGGKLHFFKGDTIKVLNSIHKSHPIKSVGYNIDYTPYARQRDASINEFCNKKDITIFAEEDYAMYNILDGKTKNQNNDSCYLVFTPFKKYCIKNLTVNDINTFHSLDSKGIHFKKIDSKGIDSKGIDSNKYSIKESDIDNFYENNNNIHISGGRKEGLKILSNIKKWKDYDKERDHLEYKTTSLSAHNHFGTVSIREVYWRILDILGKGSGLISELHWRDFYINITWYYPKILAGMIGKRNKGLKDKYDKIKWSTNNTYYEKWCEGKTGFPIIDAAMSQLNTTGYMHNRCRMIVASFLCKDLCLDWRMGEKYFASKLLDYDPMSNSGGWQWSSSVGADSQPYFRIFNPWTQQKKFDPNCIYIKKWLPILKDVDNKTIHTWDENYTDIYIKPIISHDVMRKKALDMYKS